MFRPNEDTSQNESKFQDLLNFEDSIDSLRPYMLLENRIRRRESRRATLATSHYKNPEKPATSTTEPTQNNHRGKYL